MEWVGGLLYHYIRDGVNGRGRRGVCRRVWSVLDTVITKGGQVFFDWCGRYFGRLWSVGLSYRLCTETWSAESWKDKRCGVVIRRRVTVNTSGRREVNCGVGGM